MRTMKIAAITAAGLLTVGCANLGASPTDAGSGYPESPITLIVAFDPGGSSDIGARLLADELEDELGVTVVVENRPGAGGQVGYTAIANAEPDGYTLGLTTLPGIAVSALDESRGAEYTVESFSPVALQVVDPLAIAVAPDSPYESLEDLIADAESRPGEITASTTGIGTTEHFGVLLLNREAGIDLRPVHFADGASQAATAFLGGNVDVLFGNVGDFGSLLENDSIKVIGVAAEQPSAFVPDAQTTVSIGLDSVVIGSSRGYAFPAGTPQEAIDVVSAAVGAIMADADFQKRMTDLGLQPVYMDSVEYGEFWLGQSNTLGELIALVHE
jgi:tripartite-type tricarboxylate transporter receptor subunit TctC